MTLTFTNSSQDRTAAGATSVPDAAFVEAVAVVVVVVVAVVVVVVVMAVVVVVVVVVVVMGMTLKLSGTTTLLLQHARRFSKALQ